MLPASRFLFQFQFAMPGAKSLHITLLVVRMRVVCIRGMGVCM